MFFILDDRNRLVEEKQQRYRREAEDYLLAKKLSARRMGPSVTAKIGLALIGTISLVVATQLVIA